MCTLSFKELPSYLQDKILNDYSVKLAHAYSSKFFDAIPPEDWEDFCKSNLEYSKKRIKNAWFKISPSNSLIDIENNSVVCWDIILAARLST